MSPHQAFLDKKMSFYSCGKHMNISLAGNTSAGCCAGGSPSSSTGSSTAWCRSHTAAPSTGGTCCSSPLPWPAPAWQRVHPSLCLVTCCQPPFPIREWRGQCPLAGKPAFLRRRPKHSLHPGSRFRCGEGGKMPPLLEQFTCLHIPAARHGHVSGSSFSPRPVPRCCCPHPSSPAVPHPGPFLRLFQLFTPSL